MATVVMELYELNLATLKEKRVATREYEYDGNRESCTGDDIDAQIFDDADTMINEDSAMHYTPIPEEDDANCYPGYAIYWIPDSAYCETRIYKEVINWDIDED